MGEWKSKNHSKYLLQNYEKLYHLSYLEEI